MNDVKFGTVFLGGAKEVATIPDKAVAWLDHFIEANEHFIIGDCHGVDLALQNYLHSRGYANVTVYYSTDECRFNVGEWEVERVILKNEDAMIVACNCAFLIWDGCSEDTKSSIEKLRQRGQPIFIYRTDLDRLRVVRGNCKLEKTNTNKEIKTMLTQNTINDFAEYAKNTLTIAGRTDPNLDFYKSLPICILDAVYSIGVKYSSTAKVTERYIKHFDLNISSSAADENEHTVKDFLNNIKEAGGTSAFAENVVHNRQRTSSVNGILKSEACELVARVFEKHGINTLDDFASYADKSSLDKDILTVHGQSSGIMLRYLYMLAGDNQRIKPDRMVQRFVAGIFPEIKDHDELQELIARSAEVLKSDFPEMTPRFLDYLIWEYQKNIKLKEK